MIEIALQIPNQVRDRLVRAIVRSNAARLSSARPDNALGFELYVVTVVLLGGVNIFGGRGSLLGVVLAIFIVATLPHYPMKSLYTGTTPSCLMSPI